jgi:hypothetical protein
MYEYIDNQTLKKYKKTKTTKNTVCFFNDLFDALKLEIN